jgi:hypothetical protein
VKNVHNFDRRVKELPDLLASIEEVFGLLRYRVESRNGRSLILQIDRTSETLDEISPVRESFLYRLPQAQAHQLRELASFFARLVDHAPESEQAVVEENGASEVLALVNDLRNSESFCAIIEEYTEPSSASEQKLIRIIDAAGAIIGALAGLIEDQARRAAASTRSAALRQQHSESESTS